MKSINLPAMARFLPQTLKTVAQMPESTYVRHVWKSTKYLKDKFPSSLDILDEMRPIRMIEHTNWAKAITSFVGAQIDICDAFGFKIPEGCAPKYKSRQKPTRRLSSSAKNSSEGD